MSFRGVLRVVGQSDPGLLRERNEDALGCDPANGVMVLADGMGGYQAGEVASTLAVNAIMHRIQQRASDPANASVDEHSGCRQAGMLLHDAVLEANTQIYERARANASLHGMGTTVVAVFFHGDWVSIAHVGDSRLYRLRAGHLEQLTSDHSVLQEMIDSGLCTPEQARHSPKRNLVTRALGVSPEVNVDVRELLVQSGDLFLLCSDGLTDMLEDEQLIEPLLGHAPQRAAVRLIQAANAAGGHDNISVILVEANPPEPEKIGWWTRLRGVFRGKA